MKRAFLVLTTAAALIAFAAGSRAQQDPVVQLLQALADAPGPSGFEEPVRKIMVERMKPYADKISYDGLGSVIAMHGSAGPRVMVDAHMDELGGVIRRIAPNSSIWYRATATIQRRFKRAMGACRRSTW